MNRWIGVLRGPTQFLKERALAAAAIVATGILLGQQYVTPNKRVIAVMVAAILAGVAWRVDMLWGLGVIVLSAPYPRGTVFGSSTVAFILMLLVIWLLRVTQRQASGPRRTPIDLPIAGLLIMYLVSFQNVQPAHLRPAFENLQVMIASVLLFYLIVSNVRTEAHLRRFHTIQLASLVTILLIALYELNHPGQDFIPGWISFRNTEGTEFNTRNVRVGGPFFDFELMAEFTALNLLFVLFLVARARSRSQQVLLGAVFLLTVFTLFTTVTRGAVVAMGAALVYMLWITRRRVKFVPLVLGLAATAVLFMVANDFVATHTRSGDLMARLVKMEFTGIVPEARAETWRNGWERFLEQPIIGHGPYYSAMTGVRTWFWPHNGYLLMANFVGAIGLVFYLWLLARLIWITRPTVDSLRHPSYANAFLIVGHLQLVLFAIDQVKIDFLRNNIYLFEVWIMLAGVTSAWLITRDQAAARARAAANGMDRSDLPRVA